MENNIGKVTININKKQKITNDDIKRMKGDRREFKTKYTEACNNRIPQQIETTRKQYIESRIKTRKAIEKEIQTRTKNTLEKLIEAGGVNSNNFWQIRKKLLGKGGKEDYDTITEDDITITDPENTKKHIADYFEDLYQAREGEQTHEAWTSKINNKIAEITKTTKNTNIHVEPITQEEVNNCMKQLKRGKSSRPDNIPNEALIEANHTTRKIITNVLKNIYETEKIPDQ